jgi:plastocyanin domain-containing protein
VQPVINERSNSCNESVTCEQSTELFFRQAALKKELPLNKAVDVEFTPTKAGDIAFACGMSMYKGKIVVAP